MHIAPSSHRSPPPPHALSSSPPESLHIQPIVLDAQFLPACPKVDSRVLGVRCCVGFDAEHIPSASLLSVGAERWSLQGNHVQAGPQSKYQWQPSRKRMLAQWAVCVHTSMLLQPSTCLYNVSDDSPRRRRACGKYSVGLTCIDVSIMSLCCCSSIEPPVKKSWRFRNLRAKMKEWNSHPHSHHLALHSTDATRPCRPSPCAVPGAHRRTAVRVSSPERTTVTCETMRQSLRLDRGVNRRSAPKYTKSYGEDDSGNTKRLISGR